MGGDGGDDNPEDKSDTELDEAMASGCCLSDHGDDSNTTGCSHDNHVAHSNPDVNCTTDSDVVTDSRHNDTDSDVGSESVDSATKSSCSRQDIDASGSHSDKEPASEGMTKLLASDSSPDSSVDRDSSSDNDDAPTLVSIGALNKSSLPFRDNTMTEHIDSHRDTPLEDQRVNDESKPLGMDPRLVKKKVRSQMQRKQARQLARRTRKHGEAALSTKLRRENSDDIKQSLGPVWY